MNSVLFLWSWDGEKWNLHDHYKVNESGMPLDEHKIHYSDWQDNNTAITRWDGSRTTLFTIRLPDSRMLHIHNLEDMIRNGDWCSVICGGVGMLTKTIQIGSKLL